eukprot:1162761-Amphidinium_carterae.2
MGRTCNCKCCGSVAQPLQGMCQRPLRPSATSVWAKVTVQPFISTRHMCQACLRASGQEGTLYYRHASEKPEHAVLWYKDAQALLVHHPISRIGM